MKLRKKPVIIATVSALAISGSIFVNSTYASQATKQLKAMYNNIKVIYNNQEVTVDASQEPFMVNGTTYIPLRMMGDVFDKKVTWDNTNKIVNVADKTTQVPQTTVDTLNSQIQNLQLQLNTATAQNTTKDTTIAQLQAQITSLNTQITDLKNNSTSSNSNSTTLNKLQTTLNNSYADYKGTSANIELTGNSDKLKVNIKVTESVWNDLSTSNRRTLLQNIVDAIHDNSTYDDATVTGTVVNKNSVKLLTFSTNSSNSIIIGSNVDLSTVQTTLNKDFGTYKGVKLSIELSNDNDEEIVFRIYANKGDWNSLTSYQTNTLFNSVAEEIDSAYSNMNKKIYGFVYDSSNKTSILERYNGS